MTAISTLIREAYDRGVLSTPSEAVPELVLSISERSTWTSRLKGQEIITIKHLGYSEIETHIQVENPVEPPPSKWMWELEGSLAQLGVTSIPIDHHISELTWTTVLSERNLTVFQLLDSLDQHKAIIRRLLRFQRKIAMQLYIQGLFSVRHLPRGVRDPIIKRLGESRALLDSEYWWRSIPSMERLTLTIQEILSLYPM